MGKKGRGRERLVRCEKCGRLVRRDKAVFIDKVMFANPLDRHEVFDDDYQRTLSREVAYCPSCGKHLRVYEKKKKMLQAQKEREQERAFRQRRFSRPRPKPEQRPVKEKEGTEPSKAPLTEKLPQEASVQSSKKTPAEPTTPSDASSAEENKIQPEKEAGQGEKEQKQAE
ncbi:MAG: hypothetical protein ACE5DI_04750 [Candidatus Micrarchaeia archaeon]